MKNKKIKQLLDIGFHRDISTAIETYEKELPGKTYLCIRPTKIYKFSKIPFLFKKMIWDLTIDNKHFGYHRGFENFERLIKEIEREEEIWKNLKKE